jgi:hypothetical protein
MLCSLNSKTQVRLRREDLAHALTLFFNARQYDSVEVEVTAITINGSGSVYVVTADVIRRGSTFTEDQ